MKAALVALLLVCSISPALAKKRIAEFSGRYVASVQWVIVNGQKRPGGKLPASRVLATVFDNGDIYFRVSGTIRENFRGTVTRRGKIKFPRTPGVTHRGFIRRNRLSDRTVTFTPENGTVRIVIVADRVR